MAREEEREYKPCSPTKNMECAPIWCSPFASFCRLRHRFWNMTNNSCILLSLISFDLSAGEYFEILTHKHLDLNQVLWFNGCEIISFNVRMKKLNWTRNDCEHFWLCIKILLLEIARLIPGHTCKDMDPLQPLLFLGMFWAAACHFRFHSCLSRRHRLTTGNYVESYGYHVPCGAWACCTFSPRGATLPQESPLELAFALAARLEEAQRGNEMEVFTCEAGTWLSTFLCFQLTVAMLRAQIEMMWMKVCVETVVLQTLLLPTHGA